MTCELTGCKPEHLAERRDRRTGDRIVVDTEGVWHAEWQDVEGFPVR